MRGKQLWRWGVSKGYIITDINRIIINMISIKENEQ